MPAGHSVLQLAYPSPEYCPAGQLEHAEVDEEYCPAGHRLQEAVSTVVEKEPDGQLVHDIVDVNTR